MDSRTYSDSDSMLIQSLVPLNLSKTLFASERPQDSTTTATFDNNQRTQLLTQEEAKIEREIVKAISTGKTESLKPNSGQAIPIGEHYVCVSFHEEPESDCSVWEWHGYVVSYSEASGYTQEYVYGSHFERMMEKTVDEEIEEESDQETGSGSGLRELIGGLNLTDGRVFCRNLSVNSRR